MSVLLDRSLRVEVTCYLGLPPTIERYTISNTVFLLFFYYIPRWDTRSFLPPSSLPVTGPLPIKCRLRRIVSSHVQILKSSTVDFSGFTVTGLN